MVFSFFSSQRFSHLMVTTPCICGLTVTLAQFHLPHKMLPPDAMKSKMALMAVTKYHCIIHNCSFIHRYVYNEHYFFFYIKEKLKILSVQKFKNMDL